MNRVLADLLYFAAQLPVMILSVLIGFVGKHFTRWSYFLMMRVYYRIAQLRRKLTGEAEWQPHDTILGVDPEAPTKPEIPQRVHE